MFARRADLTGVGPRPLLAACSAGGLALCTSAGGAYAAGTCTRSSAEQQAAEQQCETHGGVYLRGQDTCVVGAGGP